MRIKKDPDLESDPIGVFKQLIAVCELYSIPKGSTSPDSTPLILASTDADKTEKLRLSKIAREKRPNTNDCDFCDGNGCQSKQWGGNAHCLACILLSSTSAAIRAAGEKKIALLSTGQRMWQKLSATHMKETTPTPRVSRVPSLR